MPITTKQIIDLQKNLSNISAITFCCKMGNEIKDKEWECLRHSIRVIQEFIDSCTEENEISGLNIREQFNKLCDANPMFKAAMAGAWGIKKENDEEIKDAN